jgi:hypothetical protein
MEGSLVRRDLPDIDTAGEFGIAKPPPKTPDRSQSSDRLEEKMTAQPYQSDFRAERSTLPGDQSDEKTAPAAQPQAYLGPSAFPRPSQDTMRRSLDTAGNGDDGQRTVVPDKEEEKKPVSGSQSLKETCRVIITHSWVNVLLVFVPAGTIVHALPQVHGAVVFALNCVAVIPLAGLLAFATESVAGEMGDALGALMNVTFGNVVELIIL